MFRLPSINLSSHVCRCVRWTVGSIERTFFPNNVYNIYIYIYINLHGMHFRYCWCCGSRRWELNSNAALWKLSVIWLWFVSCQYLRLSWLLKHYEVTCHHQYGMHEKTVSRLKIFFGCPKHTVHITINNTTLFQMVRICLLICCYLEKLKAGWQKQEYKNVFFERQEFKKKLCVT